MLRESDKSKRYFISTKEKKGCTNAELRSSYSCISRDDPYWQAVFIFYILYFVFYILLYFIVFLKMYFSKGISQNAFIKILLYPPG